MVVDAIPAGPNGKIRRRMLASLLAIAPAAATRGTGDGERSSVGRPLEGAMETAVAAAWTAVLGVGTVDADEAFVALGGDSIQASRVIARLRDTLGLDLSVAMFFEAATVAAMAGVLEGMPVRQAAEPDAVAVRSEPEPEPEPVARSRAALDEVSDGG